MRLAASYLGALKWVPIESQPVPQYESKHMDDYWLEDRLNRWQQLDGGRWMQPWRSDDVIPLQFQNNAGAITIQLIDCYKVVQRTQAMTAKQQDPYDSDCFIYEGNIVLTGLSGVYFPIMVVGGQRLAVAEPILVQAEQPGTLLLNYSNYRYYENIIFEGGFVGALRFFGLLRKKPTASSDTIYEDQDLDLVMVHSKPYRVWELLIGTEGGVPDWFEDILGRSLGCSSLRLDGRYYTKSTDGKIESFDERYNGVLYSYKIELRERLNRHSRYFDNINSNFNEELEITLNSTSKGFADTDVPDNGVVTFFDTE